MQDVSTWLVGDDCSDRKCGSLTHFWCHWKSTRPLLKGVSEITTEFVTASHAGVTSAAPHWSSSKNPRQSRGEGPIPSQVESSISAPSAYTSRPGQRVSARAIAASC